MNKSQEEQEYDEESRIIEERFEKIRNILRTKLHDYQRSSEELRGQLVQIEDAVSQIRRAWREEEFYNLPLEGDDQSFLAEFGDWGSDPLDDDDDD